MTTANAQIPEPETEEKIYTVETGSQQTIAPVADEQTQAEELINSCIDPSLDCSFAAAPLKSDSISVALTLMGPAADSSVASIAEANVPMALYTDDEEDEEFVEDDEGTSGSDSEKSEDEFDGETLTTNDSPETINTENTFEIVTTTAGNPSFTIQYYANLKAVKEYSADTVIDDIVSREKRRLGVLSANDLRKNGYLPVINTRGKQLPISSTLDPSITYLKVGNDNKVETEIEDGGTQIYKDEHSKLYERPNLAYFSPGDEVLKSYKLVEIRVWSKGQDPDKNNPRHTYSLPDPESPDGVDDVTGEEGEQESEDGDKEETKFEDIFHITNRSDLENQTDKYIYIAEGDIVRLIYEPKEPGNLDVGMAFHDYDISEQEPTTQNGVSTMKTNDNGKAQGINNPNNYKGTGAHFAFGNDNAGTGLGTVTSKKKGNFGLDSDGKEIGDLINKLNTSGNGGRDVYDGCSFDMVVGLDKDGLPVFGNNVDAPSNLFTNKTGSGATFYNGGLAFKRVGDTYTLTSATAPNVIGEDSETNPNYKISNLDQLYHPGTHQHIWTNHFWPMDRVKGNDFHFGASPSTQKTQSGGLPSSDNGQDHNCYFGMNFTVNFSLTEKYEGPLQYLFFGDDDMWVFLEGPDGTHLVCDIGGVHRSIGEIVDLWDYIKKGSEGTYKLHFFFTERGASGSTCWMQFTLPSVFTDTPEPSGDFGSLRFKKLVENKIMPEGKDGEDNTDETFLFTISLTDEEGRPLSNGYKYIKYSSDEEKDENVVKVYVYHDDGEYTEYENALIPDLSQTEQEAALGDGVCFTLKKGQHILVPSLPKGTKFTIKEVGVLIGDEVPGVNPVWGEGESGKSAWRYRLKADGEADHQYEYFVGEGKCENGEYSGEIAGKDANVSVNFSNTYYSYELPKTGGAGAWGLTGAGLLLMLAAGCLLVRKRA